MPQTWLIVGASRGIGLEFVTQLLANGNIVIATARAPATAPPVDATGNASKLWSLTGTPNGHNLTILECDVSSEKSINAFTEQVRKLGRKGCVLEKAGGVIDVVVLNAGVLEYPGRISEVSFERFQHHLLTNTIGPLLTASSLLSLSSPSSQPLLPISSFLPTSPTSHAPPSPFLPSVPIHIKTSVFISSDSGSVNNFRTHEDGFGAYSVSKAALNQGLRHLAAELHRKATQTPSPSFPATSNSPLTPARSGKAPVVLAIHPGEVATDMASNVDLAWEVEGIIRPEESVGCMLKVIREKGWGGIDEGGRLTREREGRRGGEGEATFWDWRGGVYPW
ncbi:NAD(P)-binding protein [Acephala macrosclerotiorum]|nr:NAD(P)-binding protein [Acephala macrosclerotiorum]